MIHFLTQFSLTIAIMPYLQAAIMESVIQGLQFVFRKKFFLTFEFKIETLFVQNICVKVETISEMRRPFVS